VKLKKTLKTLSSGQKKTQKTKKKNKKPKKTHWAGFFFLKTRVFSNPARDDNFDIPMLLYCTAEIPALNRSRERVRFSGQMRTDSREFYSEGPGCNIGKREETYTM
jgi:hypothetical protein